MTQPKRTVRKTGLLGGLQTAAWIALPVGAAGAVGLTLRAGAHNGSLILMALFVGWVLSPFVGYAWAEVASVRWGRRTQMALHVVVLIVAVASLAVYGYVVFGPRLAKPAGVFLILPSMSWVLLGRTLINTKR